MLQMELRQVVSVCVIVFLLAAVPGISGSRRWENRNRDTARGRQRESLREELREQRTQIDRPRVDQQAGPDPPIKNEHSRNLKIGVRELLSPVKRGREPKKFENLWSSPSPLDT
ncbi:unnamed protein product [Darwinula stevensoni]|uniref:Uncharacterized protein n=1 Tax=Darwinula stevensoni TaxID=69355 RepID=A0A7R8X113_9CRUS|nr:unnamed protein product [Darwinula stevensoni]CAG0881779.1 unnamed protein product [Darwinula stevensoni]